MTNSNEDFLESSTENEVEQLNRTHATIQRPANDNRPLSYERGEPMFKKRTSLLCPNNFNQKWRIPIGKIKSGITQKPMPSEYDNISSVQKSELIGNMGHKTNKKGFSRYNWILEANDRYLAHEQQDHSVESSDRPKSVVPPNRKRKKKIQFKGDSTSPSDSQYQKYYETYLRSMSTIKGKPAAKPKKPTDQWRYSSVIKNLKGTQNMSRE